MRLFWFLYYIVLVYFFVSDSVLLTTTCIFYDFCTVQYATETLVTLYRSLTINVKCITLHHG